MRRHPKPCEWCGTKFKPGTQANGISRFCSRTCFNEAKRDAGTIERAPDPDDAEERARARWDGEGRDWR